MVGVDWRSCLWEGGIEESSLLVGRYKLPLVFTTDLNIIICFLVFRKAMSSVEHLRSVEFTCLRSLTASG